MSMNVRKRYAGKGRTPEVLAEIERIKAIWNEREAFLFGAFTRPTRCTRRSCCASHLRGGAAARGAKLLRRHARAAGDAEVDRRRERETESIPQLDMYE
jgi:hypothetical protein